MEPRIEGFVARVLAHDYREACNLAREMFGEGPHKACIARLWHGEDSWNDSRVAGTGELYMWSVSIGSEFTDGGKIVHGNTRH